MLLARMRTHSAHTGLVDLKQAVAAHVRDGMTVALEGFTHLIPFAAGHELVRQERRELTPGADDSGCHL